jgi:GNAT superfamily N-acetyltransferase
VDYTTRFALVAVDPASQRGVAMARYEPAGQDGAADVAIAVIPGWRGAGLAGELLHVLAQAAANGASICSPGCTSPTTARSRP